LLTQQGFGEPPRTDSETVSPGFFPYYREYFGSWLLDSLIPNKQYCISCWVSLIERAYQSFNRFEVLVSVTIPSQNYPAYPTFIIDTSRFVLTRKFLDNDSSYDHLSTSFMATGFERFLAFGIFSPLDSVSTIIHNPTIPGSPTRVFIDDVALYPCDAPVSTADAGQDEYLCQGSNAALGTHDLQEYRYYWYVDSTLVSREARPVVSPQHTTTYRLLVKDFKFDETWDSVTVFVVNCDTIPDACAGEDAYACLGDSLRIGCASREDFQYFWSTTQDTAVFSTYAQPYVKPTQQTSYVLRQTDYARQQSLDTVRITPVDCSLIKASAGGDQQLCLGDSLLLGYPGAEGGSYAWYVAGDPVAGTPQLWVSPSQSTTYELVASTPRKELMMDRCLIDVIVCDIPMEIPNVFTPNGDGYNDRFEVRIPEGAAAELIVFNRWGEVVFEGDHTNPWDGTIHHQPIPEGTYFYSITATMPWRRTTIVAGTVTVLR